MTTAFLVNDLLRDEGLRLTPYRDTGGVWTVGYGHTGADVRRGDSWTKADADDALIEDIAKARSELDAHLPWWRTLDDVRQDVLVEMTFNLGIGGVLKFHRTLAAVQAGRWAMASADILLSKWSGQVGERAARLAEIGRAHV